MRLRGKSWLTFDDVAGASVLQGLPKGTSLATTLPQHPVGCRSSAAMDTVTSTPGYRHRLKKGGIGIVHKTSIAEQAAHVAKSTVWSGVLRDPSSAHSFHGAPGQATVHDELGVSGFPWWMQAKVVSVLPAAICAESAQRYPW